MLSRAAAPHGRRRIVLTAVCLVTGAIMLSSGVAQARLVRPYTGESFGPEGLGAGTFSSEVKSLAVDQSSGDVYLFDQGAGAIYRFTSAGDPADFSSSGTNSIPVASSGGGAEEQIAVDGSTGPAKGDIYFANNRVVDIYSAAGLKIGELTGVESGEGNEACGVAVDPTGAVYVGFYPSTVKKYVPAENPVTNADYTESLLGLKGICNIAADSEGNVYAATYSGSNVERYSAVQFGALEAEGTLISERGATLGVDPSGNHVFINQGSRVAEYDASAKLESVAGEGELEGSLGVAVNATSGDVYAPGTTRRIEIFGAPVVVPDATTEAPTAVTTTTGTINGSVNPDGLAATYQFQYGTSTSYGSLTPATPAAAGSDSTSHHFAASLTGLEPSASYHYRIVASNANGTSYGEDQTLDTNGPPTILQEHAGVVTRHTAAIEVGVDPHGLDTHYEVEYGTSATYGSHTPAADLGSEGEALYANSELTGLERDTTYHFRVVARNAEGTAYGSDQVFSTEPIATISGETAHDIGLSAATLSARIEDFGTTATYHFEYGTTSAYGAITAPVTLPGEGGEVPPATAVLSGLQPGTGYHFRLVVETEEGSVQGADATFTTEPLAAPSHVLPDGRGYEKVSSNENADGDVYQDIPEDIGTEAGHTEQPFVVAPEGNAVAYMGDPAEHGGIGREGGGFGNQYVATRLANGHWSSANVDPPSAEFDDVPVYKGFSSDLTVGFVDSISASSLAEGAPSEAFSVLYAKTFSTDTYYPLVRSRPPNRTPGTFGAPGLPSVEGREVGYAGSTADLGHVLFMANDALTANAVDGGEEQNNLYDSSGGTTTLVNVLPDGSSEANATFGGPVVDDERPGYNSPIFAHDISEDGSRIFWTDLNTGDLYVRENDTAPQSPVVGGSCSVPTDACTVLIGEEAQFWNATPDGSKVLYSERGDLYERDLDNGQTVDLAPDGGVNGVVASSEDLSYVYFVAKGILAAGAQQQPCIEGEGSDTGCNLYAIHLGEPTRFIGLLSSSDNIEGPESFSEHDGDWQGSLSNTEAEATPDGTHLLFTSRMPLTGYENRKTEQIFMYDYGVGQLTCLSCKANGEGINGEGVQQYFSAFLPVSRVGSTLPHWITDSGNEVFFDTLNSLVPQDTNNNTDVYEWERDGSGSCRQSPGCVYMLSDGTSPEGSYLIGSSASGDDVFITTRGKLVPEDENENIDVYDVRVGAVNPPAPPKCTGSGCQGVPSAPPIFATPPSVTYMGVGNFEAPAAAAPAKPKPLTRAQKLAKALKACKKKSKRQRAACEAQAKRRYGPKKIVSGARQRRNIKQSSGRGKR